MARDLPKFVSREQLQPGPTVNRGAVFDMLANTFGRIQQTAEKDIKQQTAVEAIEQGGLAGAQPGFRPSDMGGEGARLFNEAALKANKFSVGADIGANTSRIFSDVTANLNGHQSLEEFNKLFGAYSENLLATVPKENLAFTKNMLVHQGQTAASKLNSKIQAQANRELFFQFNRNHDTYQNMASNAARNGDKKGAAYFSGLAQSQTEAGVEAGWLTARQGVQYDDAIQKEVHTQSALGQYESALRDGKGPKFIDSFLKNRSLDKTFSASEKDALVSKMEKVGRAELLKQGVDTHTVTNLKNNLLFNAQNGQPAAPEDLSRIEAFNPEEFDEFKNKLNLASQQGALVNSTDSMNTDQMITRAAELQNLPPAQIGAPNAFAIDKMRKAAATQIIQQAKELKTDPGAVSQRSRVYQAAEERFKNDASSGVLNSQVLLAKRQELDDVSLNIQRQRGVKTENLQVVPNSVAATDTRAINSMSFEGGLAQLSKEQIRYGKNFNNYFESLVKHGLNMNTHIAIGLEGNTLSEGWLPEVREAFTTSPKDLASGVANRGFKSGDIKSDLNGNASWTRFSNTVWPVNSNNLKLTEQMKGSLTRLSELFLIKKTVNSIEDANQKAFDVLIGNRYSSIENTYRVPQGVDPGAVRLMITEKNEQLKSFPFKLLGTANPLLSKDFRRKTDFEDAIRLGSWVNNSDESGLYLVDKNGRTVRGPDDNRFEFSFKDLSSPDVLARLSKEQIHAFAKERVGFPDFTKLLTDPFAIDEIAATKAVKAADKERTLINNEPVK